VLYGYPTVSLYDMLMSKSKEGNPATLLEDAVIEDETVESLKLVSGSVTVRFLE